MGRCKVRNLGCTLVDWYSFSIFLQQEETSKHSLSVNFAGYQCLSFQSLSYLFSFPFLILVIWKRKKISLFPFNSVYDLHMSARLAFGKGCFSQQFKDTHTPTSDES